VVIATIEKILCDGQKKITRKKKPPRISTKAISLSLMSQFTNLESTYNVCHLKKRKKVLSIFGKKN